MIVILKICMCDLSAMTMYMVLIIVVFNKEIREWEATKRY
jgi:hypothetical protein